MKVIKSFGLVLALALAATQVKADLPTKKVLTLNVARKIIFEGKVIGAIGVSGNTPQEDEEIAKVGAAAAAPAIQGGEK